MGEDLTGLRAKVGEDLGASSWMKVEQLRIDVFGAATDDLEPLHNDRAWCAKNSPYGRPIAFGFLTLAMLTRFFHEVTGGAWSGAHGRTGFPLNYGFERLRFVAPVREGARVRGRFRLLALEPRDEGELMRIESVVDIEGEERPALVAEWLMVWVADGPEPPR